MCVNFKKLNYNCVSCVLVHYRFHVNKAKNTKIVLVAKLKKEGYGYSLDDRAVEDL